MYPIDKNRSICSKIDDGSVAIGWKVKMNHVIDLF